jgi:hypothetical protein
MSYCFGYCLARRTIEMLKLVLVVLLLTVPALAKEHENPGNGNGNGGGREVRGAPAPLLSGLASLPFLAIGGGIYWLIRRRR